MNEQLTAARGIVEKLGLNALEAVDEDPSRLPAVARVAALIGSEALASNVVSYVQDKAGAMVRAGRAPLPHVVAAFAESLAIVETVVVPDEAERQGDAGFL